MSMRRWLVAAGLAMTCSTDTRAQDVGTTLRFERTVTPGAAGPNRLLLDSAFVVGASPLEVHSPNDAPAGRRGLGELRLYDEALGRQVPYLFVWPARAQPSWMGAGVVPVTPRKDTSGFELDLSSAYTIDRFNVVDLPPGTLKRVRLEGSGDRTRWIVIVAEGTLFNLPTEAGGGALGIRQSELAFAPVTVRYLRLTADDHAGAPLPVPRAATVRTATRDLAEPDTLRSVLAFVRRPSARRTSRYHVTLPATRLPIIGLDLDVGGAQILRRALVTEPRLASGRVEPMELGRAHLRRTTRGDVVAANLRVPMETPIGAELDLVIDDGDNPPLDLRAIRAVYASLPYVYFESPTGGALRAVYGTDRRESMPPPRYDLEALRDTVSRIGTAMAAWGAVRGSGGVSAARGDTAGALTAVPGAALDVKSFRVARAIPPGSGLTAVRLDAGALAHSRIEDVRILDAQGRQVPYLLERLGEPTVVPLAALTRVKARTDVDARTVANAGLWTWYRLSLPLAGLPDATLRLQTSARVFERHVTVITRELPRDAQPQWAGDHAVSVPWTHADPESATPPVEISLGERRLAGDSLFVLMNDGDNETIALAHPELLLPTYRLRFFRRADAPLTLVYGRDDLSAPRYDIQLIAPRLLDAPALDVAVAPEQQGGSAPARAPHLLFWAALGAAVLVLLALIARLVRAGPTAVPEDAQA